MLYIQLQSYNFLQFWYFYNMRVPIYMNLNLTNRPIK